MEKYEYIAIALLVLTLIGGAYAVRNADTLLPSISSEEPLPTPPTPSLGEAIRMGVALPPPPTREMTTKALANTTGYQALITYTDRGFEPKSATIKAGQTVRFTNNSSGALQLSVLGSTEVALAPQEFKEIAFDAKGDHNFFNRLDEDRSGVVKVQ